MTQRIKWHGLGLRARQFAITSDILTDVLRVVGMGISPFEANPLLDLLKLVVGWVRCIARHAKRLVSSRFDAC